MTLRRLGFARIQIFLTAILCLVTAIPAAASAYDAQPKLVVIVIVDQLRADYLERGRSRFAADGLRLLMDRGAYFLNCDYDYANTYTASGHATLLTGAYSNAHGILANEWWEPTKKKSMPAVADDSTTLVGVPGKLAGASPRKLLTDTLGDELKMATGGKSRVFSTSLKDRSAIFSGGFAADGAYWINPASGAWITSSFYAVELPPWVQRFNAENRAEKYWNQQWKDSSGKVLRTTTRAPGALFADVVGETPMAIEYQFEFARELIVNEKLGSGAATDLLIVGLSSPDILGHKTGPNSAEIEEMILQLDRRLGEFFGFLGRQLGLANVWIALAADHGVAPLPENALQSRIPAAHLDNRQLRNQLNSMVSAQMGAPGEYVADVRWPQVFLSPEAFTARKMSEADAERLAGEALLRMGMQAYFGKWQLSRGEVPPGETGRRYLHSYSPHSGWYVLGVPQPFRTPASGATHGSPYRYDTHVPLAFFGLPFQPGRHFAAVEPIDMAVTLAALLGINPPASASGRVLTEALAAGATRPAPVGAPR